MSDLLINLFSGLIGALIGAAATLKTAKWQLEQISKTHEEALKHQNDILNQTFHHQHTLLAAEQKLRIQLETLERIHALMENVAWPVYLKGHNLRNDWAGQIQNIGSQNYNYAVIEFRDKASTALREFGSILNSVKHLPSINSSFNKTLTFQSKFFEPVQKFINAINVLPPSINRDTILVLLNESGEMFNQAVNELSSWITECKDLTFTMRTDLLDSHQATV